MNGRKVYSKDQRKRIFLATTKYFDENDWTWRKDKFDEIICFASFGDENSTYGWNIHHVDGNPRNNNESNLVALHFDSHNGLHN